MGGSGEGKKEKNQEEDKGNAKERGENILIIEKKNYNPVKAFLKKTLPWDKFLNY